MAKGDDALAKKKNKAIRKRNRRAGAGTTDAIEGVQSHKRRRKAGTRRVCEAMCYSLPTPDDPFLNKRMHRKKRDSFQSNRSAESVFEVPTSDTEAARRGEKPGKKAKPGAANGDSDMKAQVNGSQKGDGKGSSARLPKKVVWDPNLDRVGAGAKGTTGDASSAAERAFQMAVSSIFEARDDSSTEAHAPSAGEFERQWWQACAQGVGVLGAGGGTSCVKAYVVGTAPHVSVQRKLYGSTNCPIALILVKSKDQAHSVRQICKPLKKALDIHSVSLHSDTSIELQVNGLAMQAPEIVVATPDRLCELLTLSALDVSSVSYVVVDGLDDLIRGGFREQLERLSQQLRKGLQVGVLSRTFSAEVVSAVGNWLQHPIVRAVTEENVPACSACISQLVSVVTTHESKLSKIDKILEQVRKNQENNQIKGNVLLLVKSIEQFPAMELLLKHKFVPHIISESAIALREERRRIFLAKFDTSIEPSLLSKVEVTINYDLCWPIHHYSQILTGMARNTLNGRIETLCSGAAALQANDLVNLLEACGQSVPRPLLLLAQAAALMHK